MQLTEAQKEKAKDFISKNIPPKCLVCGHSKFDVPQETFDHASLFDENDIFDLEKVVSFRTIPVICQKCGFVMSFDAKTWGL